MDPERRLFQMMDALDSRLRRVEILLGILAALTLGSGAIQLIG